MCFLQEKMWRLFIPHTVCGVSCDGWGETAEQALNNAYQLTRYRSTQQYMIHIAHTREMEIAP